MTDQKIFEGLKQPAGTPACERAAIEVRKTCLPIVLSHVLKNHGKSVDVEDLFQEVFIKVRNAILSNQYKPREKFKNFFRTVTRNTWIDELNRRKRSSLESKQLEQLTMDEYKVLENNPLAYYRFLKEHRIWIETNQFFTAWEHWTDCDCKRILTLKSEGVKGDEIAHSENITISNLYKRLERCRDDLRDFLNHWAGK